MMRSASHTRLPSSPESRARSRRAFLVLGPLHGLLWALTGYLGAVGILDRFRVMALNPVGMWDEGLESMVPMLGFFGAVMLASVIGFSAMWSAMKAYGTFSLGNRASYGFSLTGVGAGMLAAAVVDGWTKPAQVGSMPASDWAAEEAWGTGAWVMYYLPIGLPVLFLLIGLACAVSFLVGNRRSEVAEHTAEQVRATGRHTPGQITKVRFTNTWLMGQPQFEVEVAYFGMQGPCRITRLLVAEPTEAPQVGGQVDVWYDPMHPETVIIELGPASSPGPVDPRLFTSF